MIQQTWSRNATATATSRPWTYPKICYLILPWRSLDPRSAGISTRIYALARKLYTCVYTASVYTTIYITDDLDRSAHWAVILCLTFGKRQPICELMQHVEEPPNVRPKTCQTARSEESEC